MDAFTTIIMLLLAAAMTWKAVCGGWPAVVGVFTLKHPFRRPEPGPPDLPEQGNHRELVIGEGMIEDRPTRLPFDFVAGAQIGNRVIIDRLAMAGGLLAQGLMFCRATSGGYTLIIDRLVAPSAGLDQVLTSYDITTPRAMVLTGYEHRVVLQGVFLVEWVMSVQSAGLTLADRLEFRFDGFSEEFAAAPRESVPTTADPADFDFRGYPGYSSYTNQALPPIRPAQPRQPNIRSIDLDGGTNGQET